MKILYFILFVIFYVIGLYLFSKVKEYMSDFHNGRNESWRQRDKYKD